MEAWRLVKKKHARDAFTGEGAYLYGGRWNSRGTHMVYTGGTLSLAALELLVHLTPIDGLVYQAIRVTFPKKLVDLVNQADLPQNWRDQPPPPRTQQLGDEWARHAKSAVLAVPSVIVPHEKNYLINPLHPDFAKIEIGPAEPFAFDSRLIKESPKGSSLS